MNTYLIGYDLIKEGQDYTTLIEEIKKLGNWWHCIESTWIIKSNSTALNIASHLEKFIDNNDKLIVTRLSNEIAWVGLKDECATWLNDNI